MTAPPRPDVYKRQFQDPLRGTAPSMTIEENMALAYLRASHSRSPFSHITAADRREFREKLSMLGLGLEDRMDHPVGLLSGGQRQALTLLMATLVTPKLLLLDEHTAALDPATAEKVLGLTRQKMCIRDSISPHAYHIIFFLIPKVTFYLKYSQSFVYLC